MGNITDTLRKWAGLDLDSSDFDINFSAGDEREPRQWYRNARNIRTAINAANRGGALTNVLSNLEITEYILPYSGGIWPAGINRCIGAHYLNGHNNPAVIFFVWNSNGNNQILKYCRNLTDPNNPNGIVQQIMMYKGTGIGSGGKEQGWGWTRNTRITSINPVYTQNASAEYNPATPGTLVYWSDTITHMIDVDRANICGKLKSWIFYAPSISYNSFGALSQFQFTLSTFANVPVFQATVSVPPSITNGDGTYTFQGVTYNTLTQSNAAVFQYIANQINTDYGTLVKAEVQGVKLIISEVSQLLATTSFNYSYTGVPLKLYPYNWYGTSLQDRYFDRCKWQAMNVPQGTYEADPAYAPNNVRNNVWQFRLLNTYTDASPAAPGLWSLIPTNNLQCDGSNNPLLNFIDVNFENSDLIDDSTLVLFHQIWFISRALNSTIGKDKVVIQLYPEQFLDYDGVEWFCHYQFYNNISSTALDPVVSAQMFDDVPNTSEAELENASLMIEANTESGIAAPSSSNIDFKVQIVPTKPKIFRNITGKIRILTYGMGFNEDYPTNASFYEFYSGAAKYPFWQPPMSALRGGIFHNTTNVSPTPNFPYFGGVCRAHNGFIGFKSDMETSFNQLLPSGGWPVYAAGTDFFTISKQISVGLATDEFNALDTSNSGYQNSLNSFFVSNNGDIYSTFTLLVPDGEEYIIRLASHWCSPGDILNYGFPYNLNVGRSYQNTSTNVHGYFNSSNVWVYDKEISVTVNGADVDCGTFVVMDVAPPPDARIENSDSTQKWYGINGYLYDSTANPLGQANTNMNSNSYDGVSVEKALVNYGFATGEGLGIGWGEACTTDHNGYFFGIGIRSMAGGGNQGTGAFIMNVWQVGIPSSNVTHIVNNNSSLFVGKLTGLYNKNLNELIFDQTIQSGSTNGIGLVICMITTDIPNARILCSTIIKGKTIDTNGNAINSVSVIYENGKIGSSDINGNYEIVAWGDMITPMTNNFSFHQPQILTSDNNRIVDSLIFYVPAVCSATYPNGQMIGPLQIMPFGNSGYTPTNPFLVSDFVINELLSAISKALKRGATYLPALRVNNYPGKLSTLIESGKIYIPFETEDLSQFPYLVDINGNQFPPNSYIIGQPKILYNFNNSMKPTPIAASWDLMLTPDLFYGKYVQWVLNSVQYVSALPTDTTPAINTAYQNANAVAVLLDISNMATFAAQNPNSQIGYTFTAGDRIRLISDRTGNNLGQYGNIFDYPIIGTYTPTAGNPNQLMVAIPELPFEIQSGFTVEIYTPAQINPEETQLYYEMGQHFNCTNPGSTNNEYAAPPTYITINGLNYAVVTAGDTYWRGRLIQVSDLLNGFVSAIPVIIEAEDVSDFYPSIATDAGRPGQVNPENTPLAQRTKLICSGTYLPDDSINGLSTFNPNQPVEAILDPRYGAIKRLFYENNVLQIVCTGKDVTAPINRNLMYQGQSTQSIVSLSGEFFNPENFKIEAKNLGTEFGASTFTNSGIIFGMANYVANLWKWFGDEKVISDVKMITFFKQLQLDGITDCVGAYDRFYEEAVWTYWRKYTINEKPTSITLSPTLNVVEFLMPPTSPVLPIYGNLGQPPEVNSEVSMVVVADGVTYTITGTVRTVFGDDANGWQILFNINPSDIAIANAIKIALSRNPNLLAQFTFSLPETICWCEGTDIMKQSGEGQVWRGWLDITPENWCPIGADMVSFKDGKIFLTTGQGVTPNAPRNRFFGKYYPSLITPVFNGMSRQHNMVNKVWNALTVWMTQGQQVGGGNKGSCNWYSDPTQGNGIGIQNTYGQLSRLKAANFVFDENHWSIEFQRDLNDISIPPDQNNPNNPLGNRVLNGMVLRSEALTTELINDYPNEIVLYSAKANYTPSYGPIR